MRKKNAIKIIFMDSKTNCLACCYAGFLNDKEIFIKRREGLGHAIKAFFSVNGSRLDRILCTLYNEREILMILESKFPNVIFAFS